jgi:ABC-type nickel/cobalt efflux system permease component RcnA
MRRIWNMTADAGKGKSKQYLIKMFLLLNSIVWGVIAVVVAVTLKGIGLMSSWSMAESILVSAGYSICLVGLIGGTICILQNDGPDRTYLEQRQEEH